MQTGFKFRLYPTPDQASVLLRWIGCQRFIYNAKVQEDRYFRSFARKSLQHAGQWAPQDQQYSHFVTELTPWLREVPSHLLRNGAYRWKQAYSRFFKKLAGRPCIQRKTGAQSVFITSELFEFIPQPGPETPPGTTPVVNYDLTLGTKKFPVGKVRYKAHRPHTLPASITITVEAGKWYLSFTVDDGVAQPTAKETADWLSGFGHKELLDRAVGLDRGVAVPVMSSTGQAFDLSEVQRKRIAQKQASARRWQRRLSRRVKGSANRRKAAKRIEAARQYERDVRKDFAHQTSHAIVANPSTLLIVFEALGVQRMTAAPKPKQDAQGRWLPNGAKAKAGLNKAILGSAWGSIKEYTSYKALRAGKLSIEVPAHHTSQACSRCGHTHKDNRISQAEFVCQSCGHTDNADANASLNIRQRGVEHILAGAYCEKKVKRVMSGRKKKLGVDCSEVTPGETAVSRGAACSTAPVSKSQEETPTYNPKG